MTDPDGLYWSGVRAMPKTKKPRKPRKPAAEPDDAAVNMMMGSIQRTAPRGKVGGKSKSSSKPKSEKRAKAKKPKVTEELGLKKSELDLIEKVGDKLRDATPEERKVVRRKLKRCLTVALQGKTLTGYQAFASHMRPQIREKNPEMTFAQLSQAVAKEWAKLSAEDKADTKARAQAGEFKKQPKPKRQKKEGDERMSIPRSKQGLYDYIDLFQMYPQEELEAMSFKDLYETAKNLQSEAELGGDKMYKPLKEYKPRGKKSAKKD